MEREREYIYIPAFGELCAHIFQIGVPHVIDGEHKEMVILLNAFADIGE